MLRDSDNGNWGANIKPSARRSIHANCISCSNNTDMGRYGAKTKRIVNKHVCNSELVQEADEVDNVMSKFAQPCSSARTVANGKSIIRRNSIDVSRTNDSDESSTSEVDEGVLSKSSPATFSPFVYSDELFRGSIEINASKRETERSFRDRRNRSSSTFESSNISVALNNISRRNTQAHVVGRKEGNPFKYLGLIFVIAALAISINYFTHSTDTVNYNSFHNEDLFHDGINSLGDKYKVSSDSILQLRSGISTILKNQDAASFILIYDSQSESFHPKLLYNFVEELVLKTVKYLRNHSNHEKDNVIYIDTDQIKTDLDLMSLKGEVEKTGVMVVPNINNVPSELAMAFHYYCDEYNPLVKGTAIFFTLDAATCLHNRKVTHQFVEKCLLKKWNDIHTDKIGPLLTRVVNIIIDITNISY